MSRTPPLAQKSYLQDLSGFKDTAIGSAGLSSDVLAGWLERARPILDGLRQDYATGSLPLLRIAEETADIEAARDALALLSRNADTIIFLGTGGSGLGGQTLAQIGGWNIPFMGERKPFTRPRVRFIDNLDGPSLAALLATIDLSRTRFVVTSKSGGTTETLAQAIVALSAVRSAGLDAAIPTMFLGITEPSRPGVANGLRALFSSLGIRMLDHHTGIGGRFSCLTNVGLLPAMARGLDADRIRAGAREVIERLVAGATPEDFAPAAGAAATIALSKARGVRTIVLMPYTDRLGKFADWFVQLWAESLGKKGEGTSPIPALGPVDQHSQLQLFMDGPREIALTILRVEGRGTGSVIDPAMAETANIGFMGGKTVGDVVDAQAHAVVDALKEAGRPVRTIDVPVLDERATGALLMHFMLETIIAGRLLGIDPFDQPAVELAKILTKKRLAS